jgi:tripartite-type tricarboxylate transporter receptor subunit TctC
MKNDSQALLDVNPFTLIRARARERRLGMSCRKAWFIMIWPVLLLSLLQASAGASEKVYPDHPIEVVLNYPPGASLDISARIIQPPLQAALGVPVILLTKAGGAGAIGADFVARSKPDGYKAGVLTFFSLSFPPPFNTFVS